MTQSQLDAAKRALSDDDDEDDSSVLSGLEVDQEESETEFQPAVVREKKEGANKMEVEDPVDADLLEEDAIEHMLSDSDVDLEEVATRKLGYGQANFKNEKEEEEMEQLPEVERENILYTRSEKRRELIETLKLRYSQKQQQRKKEKKTKELRKDLFDQDDEGGKSSISSLSDGDQYSKKKGKRKLSRTKKQSNRSSGAKNKSKRQRYSDDDFIDDDEEFDSDSDFGYRSKKKRSRLGVRKAHLDSDGLEDEEEKLISFEDALKMQITRNILLKYIGEPFVKDFVGGFVKVTDRSGHARRSGSGSSSNYLFCEVVDIVPTERSYRVVGTERSDRRDGAVKLVDQVLILKYGKTEKEYLLSVVSNQLVTKQEFDSWRQTMERDNQEIMTQDYVRHFETRLQEQVFNHIYTPEEVKQKIERNKVKRKRKMKLNYTIEKAELERRIKYYEDANMHAKEDEEELEANQEKLEQLRKDLRDLIHDSQVVIEFRRKHIRSPGTVNERNRQKNQDTMEALSKLERSETKTEHEENPYARQPCRPKTLWSTVSSTAAKAQKDTKQGAETEKKAAKPTNQLTGQDANKLKRGLVITARLEQAAQRNKQRALNESATLHNEVKVEVELKKSTGGRRTSVQGATTVAQTETPEDGQQFKLQTPQQLKVKPKVFMSLADYMREQES